MLLLEPNRIVSVDRLIEAIWDDAPPTTARTQIQICISALRKSLALAGLPGVIDTRPPGYSVEVNEGELDLEVFKQLVAAGRKAANEQRLTEAVQSLRDGLALWRGPALADIDGRLVQSVAARLTEHKLHVLEECLDIELRLDRHHGMIGELLGLVADFPLRERLRAQLMTALYRAGRQAEALETYRLAREVLIQELGLEPGEELQRLQQAVLSGEFETTTQAAPRAEPERPVITTPVVPRMLPADITDFACHEKLVEELRQSLCVETPGPGASGVKIAAISGKGGVGKTTLALHAAHQLAENFPDGQLYAELGNGDTRSASPERILERFLRALGVVGSAIPADVAECAEMYRNRLAERRVLVILDSARSEEQVLPLLPGSASCAVIVTSRVRLAGLPGASHVFLDVLHTDQAILMLANMAGWERVHAEPTRALKLVHLCGGLPLALRVSAARLNARTHWTIEQLNERLSDEERLLDELIYAGHDIRANIAVSYESLVPTARILFCRLAMLDTSDFPGWVAIPLLDCEPAVAEDVLENLVDAQLVDVRAAADGPARYRFHDLIRVYARERWAVDDPDNWEESLHRVLSTWLSLCDEAHRREYGGDFTLIHGDALRRPLPAPIVDRLLANPLGWWEGERPALLATIRQAAASGADEACWDLAMSMITLFEARSHFDDWKDTHEVALAAVLRVRNRRGEAAMLYSHGTLSLFLQHHDEAAAQLTSAMRLFDELNETHGSALALRNIAFLDRISGRLEEALTKYEKAAEVLRDIGDRAGEAHILRSMGQIYLEWHNYEEAERFSEAALGIARTIGNKRLLAQVLGLLGETYLDRDDRKRAELTFQQVLHLVREIGDQLGEAHALLGLGAVQTRRERYELAETSLRQAHLLSERSGERLTFARACLALGELYFAGGHRQRAIAIASEALKLFDQLGATRWQARTLSLLGKVRQDSAGPAQAPNAAWVGGRTLVADAVPRSKS
jgi:DNA-binding SARP family transcriptional activator